MLKALKFVQGSVAKKDFVPALTHFVIEYGRVRGYNGVLALSSPIPFDIACKPNAEKLIKAINNCNDTVQLNLTPTGRLAVKSAGFKVFVDCIEGDTPHAVPEGKHFDFDGQAFLDGLKVVAPFIGDDASRPWSGGVLVREQSLFATNNVMLVQYWTGMDFGVVINLPRIAVKEMLRINEPPTHAQLAENSITFHYEGDRWLRTQMLDTEAWPDLGRILNVPSVQLPMQETMFAGLEVIKPFVDKLGTVLFVGDRMTTHSDEAQGASYEVEGLPSEGKFGVEYLQLLQGAAQTIDWTLYPKPCIFQNERMRGAIIGMRM